MSDVAGGWPTVMQEAQELVFGARAAAYGHPKENFERICALWNAYLAGKPSEWYDNGCQIDAKDHAIMMILVKIARLQQTPDHRDSLVDICGYVGTYEKLLRREEESRLVDDVFMKAMREEDIKATFGLDDTQPITVADDAWRLCCRHCGPGGCEHERWFNNHPKPCSLGC